MIDSRLLHRQAERVRPFRVSHPRKCRPSSRSCSRVALPSVRSLGSFLIAHSPALLDVHEHTASATPRRTTATVERFTRPFSMRKINRTVTPQTCVILPISGKSTEVSSTALRFRGLCEPAGSPRSSRAGIRGLGRSLMTRVPQPRWELPNPRQLLSGTVRAERCRECSRLGP